MNPIVNADLFDTGGARLNKVIAFCDANPPPNREVNEIRLKTYPGQIIARSKQSAATFDGGGAIFQGGRQIGTFVRTVVAGNIDPKRNSVRYRILYMNGTPCAEDGTRTNGGNETLVTANDGMEHDVPEERGIQNIIDYLIDLGYL